MALPSNVTPIDPGMMLPPPPDEDFQEALIDGLRTVLKTQALEELQPRYPAWFHKEDWPRPDPGEAMTEATRLWNEFSPLRQRFADDIAFLHGKAGQVFRDATADERRNAVFDVSAQADFELMVAQMGAIDPSYVPVADTISDRDEAAVKTDFLYACDADDERRHERSLNGPLRPEIVRTEMIFGRIISEEMYDLDADYGEQPFRSHLLDPSTCAYQTEADRGISIFVRKFRTSVGEALACYDTDGKLRRKWRDGRNRDGRFAARKANYEQCEVTTYDDRWWKLVWIDGELVIGPVEHKLGYPPYIVAMGAIGLPGFLKEIAVTRTMIEGMPGYFHVGPTSSDVALASKGLSHVHLLRYPHQIREAILNRELWGYRYAHNPALLVSQDEIAEDQGVQPFNRDPGAINTQIKDHESVDVFPRTTDNSALGSLMQIVGDGLAKVSMPMQAYGMNNASNVSGFAVDNLAQAGQDKWTPHLQTISSFYRQRAERRLQMLKDWGWLLKQGNGDRGKLVVPRQRPGADKKQYFELRPQDIRDTGCRVDVKMSNFRLETSGPFANAMAIWRSQGLITRREILEKRGVPNVEEYLKELDLEAARSDPRLIEADLIKYLVEQGDLPTAQFILSRQREAQQQQQQPSPPAAIGNSLPGLGQPPGPGTGPQAPLGPRSPQPF
jgi:hypothetical protein